MRFCDRGERRATGRGPRRGRPRGRGSARAGRGARRGRCPSRSVGRTSPRSMAMVVVLPAPLGPMKPATTPRGRADGEVVDGSSVAVALRQPFDGEGGSVGESWTQVRPAGRRVVGRPTTLRATSTGVRGPDWYAKTTSWARSRAWSLTIARLTWVRAVAGLRTSSPAISSLVRPCATRATTSRSRSVSTSIVGGASSGRTGRAANSSISRRVTLGDSSASPAATSRTARTRSAGSCA